MGSRVEHTASEKAAIQYELDRSRELQRRGKPPTWKITSIEEAERVINIQQRWLVMDAERMNRIEERLAKLEKKWWVFRGWKR